MKKIFEQPTFDVVYLNGKNIDTISVSGTVVTNRGGDAADRMGREDWSWDAGY